MNCETCRNAVLLKQSGELGSIRGTMLKRHLATCPDCRRYEEETALLTGAARRMTEDVDAARIEHILAYARKENSRSGEIRFRPSREPLLRQWRPAMIYAGLSILLLAAFLAVISPVVRPARPPAEIADRFPSAALDGNEDLDDELVRLSVMLAAAELAWTNGDRSERDEIEQLARELLEMEGAQI